MSSSIWLLGQPLAMRSRVWVSQACGSTSFILAVVRSVAMVAQVRPPPSLPANKAVLSRDCLRPDGALDDVGVDLDAAIGEEALERGAAAQGVADRLGQLGFARQPAAVPFPTGRTARRRSAPDLLLARLHPGCGILAADGLLDRPERRHLLDRPRGETDEPAACSSKNLRRTCAQQPASVTPSLARSGLASRL